jgi:hypothetical protein
MSQRIARLLRRLLLDSIEAKEQQGHDTGTVRERLSDEEDVSRLLSLADELADAPLRPDWPYDEPDDLATIVSASGAADDWPAGAQAQVADAATRDRIAASFLAAVCGCVLGKPLEVQASLSEIQAAARRAQVDWPLAGYVNERLLDEVGRRSRDWEVSTAERIAFVPPDDDLNFRLLGMLLLERRGRSFADVDIVELWGHCLPIEWVWGSNRTLLLKSALHWWRPGDEPLGKPPVAAWRNFLNPYEEDCGALIRADPFAYAAPGSPHIAASLAWREASVTHRRTGVYAAMFQAAALSAAFVVADPIEIFTTAMRFVPMKSRLHERIQMSIEIVSGAPDWEWAYQVLEAALGTYGHCRLYFELGTVINTVRFARDTGHGLGLQVSQGLDTDSFGAAAGAILGARFGPDGLDPAWLEPFGDQLRSSVAGFHELSLRTLAERMARLPDIGSRGTDRPPFIGDP